MSEWLAERAGIVLLAPAWLLLLAVGAAAGLLGRLRPPPALPFAPLRLLPDPAPRSLRQRTRWIPSLFSATAFVLLAVALARPAVRELLPRRSLGVDLMLALDCSSSMGESAEGETTTRWESVQRAALDFLAGREGDRAGLIAFARYPDLLCAPTLRLEEVAERIAGLQPVEADSPEDLTGLGGAAARAAEILRRAPGPARVLVLLSDGEENVAGAQDPRAIGPQEAAELCRAWGVRVHAIATGDPERVAGLAALANRTGGGLHRAGGAGELERVFRAIDELEAAPLAEPEARLIERGGACAAVAGVLMAAAGLLRRRPWRLLP